MESIFLLEDDQVLGRGMAAALGEPQRAVTLAGTLQEGRDVLARERFDLVILDINLPDGSGLDLLRQLRGAGNQTPVILLTANDRELDEVTGLEAGADDYITKPFSLAVLRARVAARLRCARTGAGEDVLCRAGAVLHPESGRLEYQGRTVELTKTEQKILCYLFRHAGAICPRADLVDFLWDNQLYIDDNALSVHVSRIREKLASIGLTDFIRTKHRQGYRI